MVRSCAKIDDAGEFVAAAVPLLRDALCASSGKHDFPAAQALYQGIIVRRPYPVGSGRLWNVPKKTMLS